MNWARTPHVGVINLPTDTLKCGANLLKPSLLIAWTPPPTLTKILSLHFGV
ncbi:hypothetical protein BACUNI_02039 [Bacteroides uniformis ATCC 8492]|uniref:Uncharacterized protein n=1 Tax=Bacteroides uniformis (strain ATCC 8492 / DSM 6597 / CCUG 4942 / CIP 103695 / JCM 5828 / KCTC 5204 / NCTC 13054 / VPI 0061) TaxID=411479 RepID=A0ABC9NBD2_BACUC|nr:hypothetical protein BACUNI_02039 [Bacteroides uniformis ATCC 8492]